MNMELRIQPEIPNIHGFGYQTTAGERTELPKAHQLTDKQPSNLTLKNDIGLEPSLAMSWDTKASLLDIFVSLAWFSVTFFFFLLFQPYILSHM